MLTLHFSITKKKNLRFSKNYKLITFPKYRFSIGLNVIFNQYVLENSNKETAFRGRLVATENKFNRIKLNYLICKYPLI